MRKYRCMIVDDEELILQRLQLFFSKHSQQYEVVAKAYSGEEGLALALRLRPDIIITDIVMPKKNGLELIEQLTRHSIDAYIIILSAFPDFDYAKTAIQLNVKDYIIKVPLKEQDILKALDNATRMLQEKEQKDSELDKLNKLQRENVYRMRKQYFTELIDGELAASRLRTFRQELQLQLDIESYCCAIIGFDKYDEFRQAYSIADQGIIKYGMINTAEETLGRYGKGFTFQWTDARFLCFLSWDNMRSAARTNSVYYTLGRELIHNLNRYMKQSVSVTFSGVYQGWESLVPAYREAIKLEQALYYREPRSIITYSEWSSIGDGHRAEARRKVDEWLTGIGAQTTDERLEALEELASWVKRHGVSPGYMGSMMKECADKLLSVNNPLQEPRETDAHFAELRFEDQMQWLAELIGSMADRPSPIAERSEITKAKAYIREHISQPISLGELAEYVNLSKPYLSLLFKKEMQEGFTDYVNRLRIDYALELMAQGYYSNFELSQAVGIFNERYFCTLFKQYTGTTPQKYGKKRRHK